jgi:hypothetical protein
MKDEVSFGGIIDAALEISARRRETLGLLKEALERGRKKEALELARQLCGVSDDQKGNRADPSLN